MLIKKGRIHFIFKNKHNCFKFVLIAFILFSILIGMFSFMTIGFSKYKNSNSFPDNSPIVIVDAGHGGFDGGAVVGNVLEKDINLKISKTLSAMLRCAGVTVIETRTDDNSTETNPNSTVSARKKSDLQNRLNLTKKYPDAIFVSIHLNKFPSPSAKGAQIFYGIKNENSPALAENIRSEIVSLIQNENTRTLKKGTKSTYLLYNSPVPTVIVECGFMSNQNDMNNLLKEEYQNNIAFAVFKGILDYFN